MCAVLLAGSAAALAADRDAARRLPGGEPVLRAPFAAGAAVACLQGNRSAPGRTHSLPYCRYALDLYDPTGEVQEVVAAADGVVHGTFVDATPGDPRGGYDFGNHVKIDHGEGYYTLYAHLDRVLVGAGRKVAAGTPIGTLGRTGNTGPVLHLHFSLHRGDAREPAVTETVPIHALVAADLDRGGGFGVVCGPEFAAGGLYASENDGRWPPHLGPPAGPAAAKLRATEESARRALGSREKAPAAAPPAGAPVEPIEAIHAGWRERGPRWALARFEERVEKDPADLVSWYWIAVISRRDLGLAERAKEALDRVLGGEPEPPRWPGWLLPWTHARLGLIDEAEGRAAGAAERYRRALSFPDKDGTGFPHVAREGLARLEAAGGGD